MSLTCATVRQTLVKIRADLESLHSLNTAAAAEQAVLLMEQIDEQLKSLEVIWTAKAHKAIDKLVEEFGISITDEFIVNSETRTIQVQGNLHLSFCSSLTKLPPQLSVQGYLDLRHCTSLIELPRDLSVQGDLNLKGCTSLTKLTSNLSVQGDLILELCTYLIELPPNLSVQGDLNLKGCTSLTKLPSDLKVEDDLYIPKALKKDAQKLKEQGAIQGDIYIG